MTERYFIDWEAYHHQVRTGPCFICEIAAGHPDFPAHVVFQDENALAFLDTYPIFRGHTLVAPRAHREHVTGNFTTAEYLDLQRIVHRVAEAVRQEVQPERVYLLALGSQQGNSHVHWHIVPLPPGVPYHAQQLAALRRSQTGILQVTEEEQTALAARIRLRLAQG